MVKKTQTRLKVKGGRDEAGFRLEASGCFKVLVGSLKSTENLSVDIFPMRT